jgi:hypothetical protein
MKMDKNPRSNTKKTRAALLLVFALAAGCTSARDAAQKEPEAPSFEHLQDTQLRSSMWVLARHTSSLRSHLERSAAPDADTHGEIVRLVDAIVQEVENLEKTNEARAHPILGGGLPGFSGDVAAAQAGLKKMPPDYGPARDLSNACKRCHVVAKQMPTPSSNPAKAHRLARN